MGEARRKRPSGDAAASSFDTVSGDFQAFLDVSCMRMATLIF
jgi:hypothetical protein